MTAVGHMMLSYDALNIYPDGKYVLERETFLISASPSTKLMHIHPSKIRDDARNITLIDISQVAAGTREGILPYLCVALQAYLHNIGPPIHRVAIFIITDVKTMLSDCLNTRMSPTLEQ